MNPSFIGVEIEPKERQETARRLLQLFREGLNINLHSDVVGRCSSEINPVWRGIVLYVQEVVTQQNIESNYFIQYNSRVLKFLCSVNE